MEGGQGLFLEGEPLRPLLHFLSLPILVQLHTSFNSIIAILIVLKFRSSQPTCTSGNPYLMLATTAPVCDIMRIVSSYD